MSYFQHWCQDLDELFRSESLRYFLSSRKFPCVIYLILLSSLLNFDLLLNRYLSFVSQLLFMILFPDAGISHSFVIYSLNTGVQPKELLNISF